LDRNQDDGIDTSRLGTMSAMLLLYRDFAESHHHSGGAPPHPPRNLNNGEVG
jgi:hypothetical protein